MVTFTQKELSDIFLSVAEGKCGYSELLQWILSHM